MRALEQLNPEELEREELALEFDLHVRDCQDSFERYGSDPELFRWVIEQVSFGLPA